MNMSREKRKAVRKSVRPRAQRTGGVGVDVERVTHSWHNTNATWNIVEDVQKDQKWGILN